MCEQSLSGASKLSAKIPTWKNLPFVHITKSHKFKIPQKFTLGVHVILSHSWALLMYLCCPQDHCARGAKKFDTAAARGAKSGCCSSHTAKRFELQRSCRLAIVLAQTGFASPKRDWVYRTLEYPTGAFTDASLGDIRWPERTNSKQYFNYASRSRCLNAEGDRIFGILSESL